MQQTHSEIQQIPRPPKKKMFIQKQDVDYYSHMLYTIQQAVKPLSLRDKVRLLMCYNCICDLYLLSPNAIVPLLLNKSEIPLFYECADIVASFLFSENDSYHPPIQQNTLARRIDTKLFHIKVTTVQKLMNDPEQLKRYLTQNPEVLAAFLFADDEPRLADVRDKLDGLVLEELVLIYQEYELKEMKKINEKIQSLSREIDSLGKSDLLEIKKRELEKQLQSNKVFNSRLTAGLCVLCLTLLAGTLGSFGAAGMKYLQYHQPIPKSPIGYLDSLANAGKAIAHVLNLTGEPDKHPALAAYEYYIKLGKNLWTATITAGTSSVATPTFFEKLGWKLEAKDIKQIEASIRQVQQNLKKVRQLQSQREQARVRLQAKK